MKIAASIMAAGLSTRFPGEKLLAKLAGKLVVIWAVETLLNAEGISFRSIVARREFSELLRGLRGFDILINDNPRMGLSHSIKIALNWVPADCVGLLIMLGDQPLVSSMTINRLVREFTYGDYLVVSASVNKTPVNPAIFHRRIFNELRELAGDVGAKQVILRHLDRVRLIEVDERELVDVDDAETLALAERYGRELGVFK